MDPEFLQGAAGALRAPSDAAADPVHRVHLDAKGLRQVNASLNEHLDVDEILSNHSEDDALDAAIDNMISQSPRPNYPTAAKSVLLNRDHSAVEYTKAELNEGDTLVIIKYPEGKVAYNAAGFPLRDTLRVHSENLLGTNSSIFKNLLTDRKQEKARQRYGYPRNPLPPDIKYVIDLTPPDEGDEALDLTADLSCPESVLKWKHTGKRNGVRVHIIGGTDEIVIEQGTEHTYGVTTIPMLSEPLPPIPSEDATQNSSNDAVPRSQSLAWKEKIDKNGEYHAAGAGEEVTDIEEEGTPLDYCPIRHRAGIERLLQCIEGKNPRLDSAPKVWTLVMLAKYFDCVQVVGDVVFAWMMIDPNIRFIETHPEATLRIAMVLKNSMLTRFAYAILVSEEALKLGFARLSADNDRFKRLNSRNNPAQSCRPREDMDEDTVNMIQHAGLAFAAKIQKFVDLLLDPELAYFQDLPELDKIQRFESWIDSASDEIKSADLQKFKNAASELRETLTSWIRGRILWSFMQKLTPELDSRTCSNEKLLRWKNTKPAVPRLDMTYDILTEHERVLTRAFWLMLGDNLDSKDGTTNLGADSQPPDQPFCGTNTRIAVDMGIRRVTVGDVIAAKRKFNYAVTDANMDHGYNSGQMPIYFPDPLDVGDQYFDLDTDTVVTHDLSGNFVRPVTPPPQPRVKFCRKCLFPLTDDHWKDHLTEAERENLDSLPPSADGVAALLAKLELDDYIQVRRTWSQKWEEVREPAKISTQTKTVRFQTEIEEDSNEPSVEAVPRPVESQSRGDDDDWMMKYGNEVVLLGDDKESVYQPKPRNAQQWFSQPSVKDTNEASSDSASIVGIPRSIYGDMNNNVLLSDTDDVDSNFSDGDVPSAFDDDHVLNSNDGTGEVNPKSAAQFNATGLPNFMPIFHDLPATPISKGKGKEDSQAEDSVPTKPFMDPLFYLKNFFQELRSRANTLTTILLSLREFESFSVLTPTLLCFSEEEGDFDFLPLWAGGTNDGTGGVFESHIPPAERGGPCGPGPSYHTGSTVNSLASDWGGDGTEIDFDGRSSVFGGTGTEVGGYKSSVAVEDGYSDHIDRRRVVAYSDVESASTWSDVGGGVNLAPPPSSSRGMLGAFGSGSGGTAASQSQPQHIPSSSSSATGGGATDTDDLDSEGDFDMLDNEADDFDDVDVNSDYDDGELTDRGE